MDFKPFDGEKILRAIAGSSRRAQRERHVYRSLFAKLRNDEVSDEDVIRAIRSVPIHRTGITLLANASVSGATTSGITTTGASLFVVVAGSYDGVPITAITDSKSNSWSSLTLKSAGFNSSCQIFYSSPTVVGTSHTFTNNGSVGSMCIAAFSGTAASPFDVQGAGGGSSGAATIQPGSILPGSDNQVVISGLTIGVGGSPVSINGGFSITNEEPVGSNFGSALAYLVQTTATAANPTWTLHAISQCSTVIASFKAASTGGPFPWFFDQSMCGGFQDMSGY